MTLNINEFEYQPQTIIIDKYYIRNLKVYEGCPELVGKTLFELTQKHHTEKNCNFCLKNCLEKDQFPCLHCKKIYHENCRVNWILSPKKKVGLCTNCKDKVDICAYCYKTEEKPFSWSRTSIKNCSHSSCKTSMCTDCISRCQNDFKIYCRNHLKSYGRKEYCNTCASSLKKCHKCRKFSIMGIDACQLCKHDYCYNCKPRYQTSELIKNSHHHFTNLYDFAYMKDKKNDNYCHDCIPKINTNSYFSKISSYEFKKKY